MTRKSRYFLVGSAGILLLGIGGGLLAYYRLNRAPAVPTGLPAELRFVPADAGLVAYADVHSVMASEMRRELERIATGQHRGQQQMHEFMGIDVEKNINHIVAYMRPDSGDSLPSRALVLAQGNFDQAHVEQVIRDHGGTLEDYHGKHILVRPAKPEPSSPDQPQGQPPSQQPARSHEEGAIGFVQPDLVAVGSVDLVRAALDVPAAGTSAANITSNADLMKLILDASSGNAWVVGSFDAVSRRMHLPDNVRQQVPPLRLVSASARIDGGARATIKAETADAAAADQLRDVVRGAISFARLQAGSKPELQDALKSIELGGAGTRVQLSFQITPEAIRAIVPQRPNSTGQPPQTPTVPGNKP
jgi:hypothetical protein